MKKLMSSMLAIAAMASMISCTTEDILDEGGQIDNGPVEIKLNAGVSATTKAIITPDFTEDFKVFFFKPANGTTATWDSGETLEATVKGTPVDGKHAIIFDTKQYYDDAEANNTYLAACYTDGLTPTANLSGGNITFTITGQEDIMATEGKSGNKKTPFTSFTFNHLLTQIDVVLKGDAAAQAAFGKIKLIRIKQVPTELKLTLAGSPQIAPVANGTTGDIEIYNETAGVDLAPNTDDATTGHTVMIYNQATNGIYGTTDAPLTLEVVSEKGGTDGTSTVTIENVTNGLQPSQKHIITLNFKEKINATATVAAWTSGNTGKGDVE